MAIAFYFDVNMPIAVAEQLARRGIDVLRAQDDGRDQWPDEELLQRATELGRVMVTGDIRFWSYAQRLANGGHDFGGLVFAHPMQVTIGQFVRDLELIALAAETSDVRGKAQRLPL